MSTLTLLTVHGPVDLCFAPAGFADGYEALRPGEVVVVSGVSVPVASLGDVVTSKRSAGRPKDIVALPALEERLRRSATDPSRTQQERERGIGHGIDL